MQGVGLLVRKGEVCWAIGEQGEAVEAHAVIEGCSCQLKEHCEVFSWRCNREDQHCVLWYRTTAVQRRFRKGWKIAGLDPFGLSGMCAERLKPEGFPFSAILNTPDPRRF